MVFTGFGSAIVLVSFWTICKTFGLDAGVLATVLIVSIASLRSIMRYPFPCARTQRNINIYSIGKAALFAVNCALYAVK